MFWTPERVDELKRLWLEGLPMAEIGRRLGITKNAVVGKAFRMGLQRRPSVKPREEPDLPRVVEFSQSTCVWPVGHPGDASFHFCGERAVPGKPYCTEHVARAYVARTERGAIKTGSAA
jgi:GcrA cell cycle regulator